MARRTRLWSLQGLLLLAGAALLLAWWPQAASAQQPSQGAKLGHAAQHKNMQLVGHNDLQARSAYQPLVHKQGARYIAYVGHHGGTALNPMTGVVESNGTSVVDVTDPQRPVYLTHISGGAGAGEGGGAQMARVCDGRTLPRGNPAKVYLLRAAGSVSHEIWDVTAPEAPTLLTTIVSGLEGTHKNWWECETGIAYLVSGVPGWRTDRMTQVFDLSNPAAPVHIRDFGLVGQQPGATGPVPQELHGCISVIERNRIYCGHGTNSNGIVVILDRAKLLNGDPTVPDRFAPTPANLNYPVVSRLDTPPFMGAHTTFPVLGVEVRELAKDSRLRTRDFIAMVNEASGNECTTATRQMVFILDITVETKPWPIANFNVAEASGDFCDRGGRFGAHASNESFTPVFYKKLVFVSWFNAGVRAVDIRAPFSPREAGFYIPATTENTDVRCITVGGVERCKVAIQTNNVEVDDRGFIYLADRANTGLHIVELTGPAREIAGLP